MAKLNQQTSNFDVSQDRSKKKKDLKKKKKKKNPLIMHSNGFLSIVFD